MKAWRTANRRYLISCASLVAFVFIVLPPKNVCLREFLTHAGCCLQSQSSAAETKPCCEACAVREKNQKKSPAPSLPQSQGKLCFIAPAVPYVASERLAAVDSDNLVVVDFVPHAGQLIADTSAEYNAQSWQAPAALKSSLALERGSCVLRI